MNRNCKDELIPMNQLIRSSTHAGETAFKNDEVMLAILIASIQSFPNQFLVHQVTSAHQTL